MFFCASKSKASSPKVLRALRCCCSSFVISEETKEETQKSKLYTQDRTCQQPLLFITHSHVLDLTNPPPGTLGVGQERHP